MSAHFRDLTSKNPTLAVNLTDQSVFYIFLKFPLKLDFSLIAQFHTIILILYIKKIRFTYIKLFITQIMLFELLIKNWPRIMLKKNNSHKVFKNPAGKHMLKVNN